MDIKEILKIINEYLINLKKNSKTEIPKIFITDPKANYILRNYILNI